MDGEALIRMRQLLSDRRRALIEEGDVPIDRIRKDPSEIGGDEDEQPLTEMIQALASNRNRARMQELRLIDEAISRLVSDPEMFGLCEMCEEPIAPRRLEAMPHARMCVGCQSQVEDPVKRGPRRKLTDFV